MENIKIQKNTVRVTVKKPCIIKWDWKKVLIYLIKVLDPETTPKYTMLLGLTSYVYEYGKLTQKQQNLVFVFIEIAIEKGLL